MNLRDTHSFKQIAELTGISISTLKRENKKRKVVEFIQKNKSVSDEKDDNNIS